MQKGTCDRAHEKPIPKKHTLILDPTEFRGGVAIWGSVAPVYSTARHSELEVGVHIHARHRSRQKKSVDLTYKLVRVKLPGSGENYIDIQERDATQFLISSVFGQKMSFITCTACGEPHLDEDLFCVSPHRKHLCHACGRDFFQKGAGIGNPLVGVEALFRGRKKRIVSPANRKLDIRQSDFPAGIELWGSNPAVLWTGTAPEECGIHFHGYTDNFAVPEQDETYDTVRIDGVDICEEQLRILMAQFNLPHLKGRMVALECPQCGKPHFDTGERAYTPHAIHECDCGGEFTAKGTVKLTVSNPLIGTLKSLEGSTSLHRRQ